MTTILSAATSPNRSRVPSSHRTHRRLVAEPDVDARIVVGQVAVMTAPSVAGM
jgi:hypothetical protein